MSDVAASINKCFGAGPKAEEVQPSEDFLFITPSQLKATIAQAVAEATEPLKAEIQDLRQEVQHLKDTTPGITASRVDDAFEAISDIDEHLAKIDRTRTTTSPQGSKTVARITKMDEVLKARGSTTLKEMERILKIRPQEMSRILRRLDKRRYEIFIRNGDEREKVIKLKVQIKL